MTWATDNRWSAGAAAGRTEIPEDSPAAYAARWIDQGARCDVLPDRQGFAYNDQADRDRLIVKLSAEDYARNMPALDNDVATLLPGDHGEWRVWMRRAGGYVYVDAWLVPEVETPPAHWFAEGSRVDDSDESSPRQCGRRSSAAAMPSASLPTSPRLRGRHHRVRRRADRWARLRRLDPGRVRPAAAGIRSDVRQRGCRRLVRRLRRLPSVGMRRPVRGVRVAPGLTRRPRSMPPLRRGHRRVWGSIRTQVARLACYATMP